jgi:hypothetical protein
LDSVAAVSVPLQRPSSSSSSSSSCAVVVHCGHKVLHTRCLAVKHVPALRARAAYELSRVCGLVIDDRPTRRRGVRGLPRTHRHTSVPSPPPPPPPSLTFGCVCRVDRDLNEWRGTDDRMESDGRGASSDCRQFGRGNILMARRHEGHKPSKQLSCRYGNRLQVVKWVIRTTHEEQLRRCRPTEETYLMTTPIRMMSCSFRQVGDSVRKAFKAGARSACTHTPTHTHLQYFQSTVDFQR